MNSRHAGHATAVFVVSTGRCGSTLVSNMLRLHPTVLSLSELFSMLGPGAFPPGELSGPRFWELLSTPNERWTFLVRSGLTFDEALYRTGPDTRFTTETGVPPIMITTLPHLSEGPESLFDEVAVWAQRQEARDVGGQYRRLFAWLCERFGKRHWAERSGASLPRVPLLARAFPEARFAHLYRDGRDCAMSMSQHNGYRLMHRFGILPTVLRLGQPDAVEAPSPAAMAESFDRETFLGTPAPLDVMGRFWSDMVVQGVSHLRALDPDRVMDVSYEDLVAEPALHLRRLAGFIGADAGDRWLEEAAALARPRSAGPPGWTTLPGDERRRLTAACAPGLELLYGAGALDPDRAAG